MGGKSFKNCALGLPCQVENMSDNGLDYNFPDKVHISKMFSKRDVKNLIYLECIYLTYALLARTHFQYKELI